MSDRDSLKNPEKQEKSLKFRGSKMRIQQISCQNKTKKKASEGTVEQHL